MKNSLKAIGMAVLVSGVFTVANAQNTAPAQKAPAAAPAKAAAPAAKPNTDKVLGKDAKGNTVYQGAKGNYYINDKGVQTPEPKDAKITATPAPKTK